MSVFSNKRKFEKALREAQKAELDLFEPKRKELESVERLIRECETEAAKYAKALLKTSGIVGRALKAQINEVETRHTALTRRREELKDELASQKITDDAIKAAMQFREDVFIGMQNPTFEDKWHVLEFLHVQVIIQEGKAKISCIIRTQPAIEFDTRIRTKLLLN